ncbi:MAG: hypothetical protein WC814_02190 [Candidatus Paceibacterota bacterium]|jgi:hypothetical protein
MEHLHTEGGDRARVTPESIQSAAIRFNGGTYTGINHAYAIRQLEKEHPDWQSVNKEPVQEGFLTSAGRFVDRDEAGEIAERASQLDHLDGEERAGATSNLDSYHLPH